MQWEENNNNNNSVLGVCVGGNVFVLLLTCFAPQFLMLLCFMILRRCLQRLSHDSREVKFLTAFSWLSCSSDIYLFQITVCVWCATVVFLLLTGVLFLFRDHSH